MKDEKNEKKEDDGFGCLLFIVIVVILATVLSRTWGVLATRKALRTVALYTKDGASLRQWIGEFCLEYDSNRVSFFSGDKQIVICGGVVVNEEM